MCDRKANNAKLFLLKYMIMQFVHISNIFFNEFEIIIMMMMMMMMMMINSVYCCVQPKICLLETWYLNFFWLQVFLFVFLPFTS